MNFRFWGKVTLCLEPPFVKYYWSSTRFVYEYLPPEIGQITNSNPIPLDSPIIGFLRMSPIMKKRREKKRGKPFWKVYNRVRPVIYLHLGCCFGVWGKKFSDGGDRKHSCGLIVGHQLYFHGPTSRITACSKEKATLVIFLYDLGGGFKFDTPPLYSTSVVKTKEKENHAGF